jgi:DNA adenine methylase
LKSLLRYPGGKTRALKHITPYFPKNLTEMVSPFFGGGSIEIHYASQGARVHGYDIFEPLTNFWQYVLDDPEGLAHMLEEMFHPCTKDMFLQYQRKQGWTHMDDTHMLWGEMRACMFYALNRSSFSGATLSGGYSKEAAAKRFTQSSIARLKNFVCPSLSVDQACFTDSLRRHDDETFIYADPPYLLEKSTLYGERGSTHKDFDHQRFAEEIKKKNNWVISYNPHPEILELYKDYEIVYPEWAYGMHGGKKKKGSTEKVKPKKSQEILILNVKENEDALFIDD